MEHLHNASFRKLPYLRLMFMVLSGFTLTNLAIIAFTQSTQRSQSPFNPFLEYADVLPGQPEDALKSRPFSCRRDYNYNFPGDDSCNLEPSSSIFSRVEPVITKGYIRQTTFTLRDDTLKIGDLVLLLGDPQFRVYPRKTFFFYNNYFVIVSTTATGDAAAMRPVWSVTFTNRY